MHFSDFQDDSWAHEAVEAQTDGNFGASHSNLSLHRKVEAKVGLHYFWRKSGLGRQKDAAQNDLRGGKTQPERSARTVQTVSNFKKFEFSRRLCSQNSLT